MVRSSIVPNKCLIIRYVYWLMYGVSYIQFIFVEDMLSYRTERQ